MATRKHRPTKRNGLLKFMTESPDGKYEVTEPTDEQLAAVLPWLVDQSITFARIHGYCSYVNEALPLILGQLNGDERVKAFYNADGFDCNGLDRNGFDGDGFNQHGFDKDGFNRRGYNMEGYNKEGYNRDGYDREGYNRRGIDYWGNSRTEAVKKTVEGWTPDYAAMIAKLIAEKDQAKADVLVTEIVDTIKA